MVVLKLNDIDKEFIVITGSTLSIMPADESKLKKTELQKVKHRYQVVNMNELKFGGMIPADFKYQNCKQKMQ